MKTTRKITAIGLALLMIIVCGASVFAEENQFTSNEAVPGGAVYFNPEGSPVNVNFTDGKAAPGGAIYFNPEGGSVNVNFTDEKAAPGGAIYHPGK